MSTAVTLFLLWAFVGCSRTTCTSTFTIKGDNYLSGKHGTFRSHLRNAEMQNINAEFGVLPVMLRNMQVLWDVTPHTDVSNESGALIFTVKTMMANAPSKRRSAFPVGT